MPRHIAALVLLLMAGSSCGSVGGGNVGNLAEGYPWPEYTIAVMDEIPDKPVALRIDLGNVDSIAAPVKRVLLLPIVLNYQWNGKRHPIALADPIVFTPGEGTIKEALSFLSKDGQFVHRCITIAHGYCPAALRTTPFEYVREYKEKDAQLVEMTKLSQERWRKASEIMMKELSGTSLNVTIKRNAYPPQFDESVQKGKMLSNDWICSPTPRDASNYQKEYILWNIRYDETVPVCFSPEGLARVKAELLGSQDDQEKESQTNNGSASR